LSKSGPLHPILFSVRVCFLSLFGARSGVETKTKHAHAIAMRLKRKWGDAALSLLVSLSSSAAGKKLCDRASATLIPVLARNISEAKNAIFVAQKQAVDTFFKGDGKKALQVWLLVTSHLPHADDSFRSAERVGPSRRGLPGLSLTLLARLEPDPLAQDLFATLIPNCDENTAPIRGLQLLVLLSSRRV
jgi:hypothetical protein